MSTGRPRWRLRFALFFPRLWLVKEWRASSLPVAVFLKRFLAPEWVFIFGIERCIEADGFRSARACGTAPRRLQRAAAKGRRSNTPSTSRAAHLSRRIAQPG